ncbi:unnamed protein product [Rhizoctonia solani]|uniref:Uncharacterized protein n=1 Tax=Rhizoctonia solani TaxID=456999 RepID=A0A8H2Y3P8_9AGAM|nr:unnamed protein product [Rhizoctonia solani]
MSSTQMIPTCNLCGGQYPTSNTDQLLTPNICPVCAFPGTPWEFSTFTPTTPVANVETVQGIYLPANNPQAMVIPVKINIHNEPAKAYRVPQIDFLGPRNTLFNITIRRGAAGQLLSSPYHVYFQTQHRNLPNQCASAITQGSLKYQWFGDIVVLKFDGKRMERFTDASLTGDMVNVSWFFLNEVIPSQEVQV